LASSAHATIRLVREVIEEFGEERVYVLGLSSSTDPGDNDFALLLQVSEPDREGCGYSVVAEPGQRTSYKGVARCQLDRGMLSLTLDGEAASELELPLELMLVLELADDEFSMLTRGLDRVGLKVNVGSSTDV
jgi:hypothetical protein